MRILCLSSTFPNAVDPGKGASNVALFAALARKHAVKVIVPVAKSEARVSPFVESASLIPLPEELDVEYVTCAAVPKPLSWLAGHFHWWSTRRTLLCAIEEFAPEILFSEGITPDGDTAVRAAYHTKRPVVLTISAPEPSTAGGYRMAAIRRALIESDAVITASGSLADHVLDLGAALDDVHVVQPGVDCKLFCPGNRESARRRLQIDPDVPLIVSVGRRAETQTLAVVIGACRRLADRGQVVQCRLILSGRLFLAGQLIGADAQQSALQDLINRLELADRVQLLGWQSPCRLPDWYRAADLAVFPGLSEGVPSGLFESIACGSSLVAGDVAEIREFVDPRFDRLVKAGSPRELADAIADRLAEGRVDGPRRYVPRSVDEAAVDLERIFFTVCEGRATRQSRTLDGRSIQRT